MMVHNINRFGIYAKISLIKSVPIIVSIYLNRFNLAHPSFLVVGHEEPEVLLLSLPQ